VVLRYTACMTWAGRRQLLTFSIIGAIVVAIVAVVLIATLYQSPTCTDGKQNQSEEGIDCGGSCPYLCTASVEAPTVLFTKALPNGEGRTDIIAFVENKNATAAAKAVSYTIALYGFDQTLIQSVSGTLDLPPLATMPIFLTGVASGRAAVGTAFLAIDPSAVSWYSLPGDPRILPTVLATTLTGSTDSPRVTTSLTNPDVRPMSNIRIIAIVRDASGNAIAASQTLVSSIPPQGAATATFTWNAPFVGVPVSIQVIPVIPLP